MADKTSKRTELIPALGAKCILLITADSPTLTGGTDTLTLNLNDYGLKTILSVRGFVLDTNVIEMRVLQDPSYEELAKTNDSVKFMLKAYESLVVKVPQSNFVIYSIVA